MTYPILAVETTGPLASVALKTKKDGRVFTEGLTEKLNHLKGLIPLMDELLKGANIEIGDVKTIAVSEGPGSFTGIRIGISTVRAIAQITGAKVISVPTLETFVYNDPLYGGIVCPIFDARMEQMYSGAFALEGRKIETLIPTGAYSSADYFSKMTKLLDSGSNLQSRPLDFKFFGDGLEVFDSDIVHWGGRIAKEHFTGFSYEYAGVDRLQVATSVLKWAETFGTEINYDQLLPVYLRQAEAQRRLDEKNACK